MIHKYPLMIVPEQYVVMPRLARVLTVQMQNGYPCLWARFDESVCEPLSWRFVIIPTGGEEPRDGHYLGTVQNFSLVWHVFEVPNPPRASLT